MFPTSHFRVAYDQLAAQHSIRQASKEYLRILHLAATESETHVNRILMFFWHNDQPIRYETVKAQLASVQQLPSATEVKVDAIDLRDYDVLLERVV